MKTLIATLLLTLSTAVMAGNGADGLYDPSVPFYASPSTSPDVVASLFDTRDQCKAGSADACKNLAAACPKLVTKDNWQILVVYGSSTSLPVPTIGKVRIAKFLRECRSGKYAGA